MPSLLAAAAGCTSGRSAERRGGGGGKDAARPPREVLTPGSPFTGRERGPWTGRGGGAAPGAPREGRKVPRGLRVPPSPAQFAQVHFFSGPSTQDRGGGGVRKRKKSQCGRVNKQSACTAGGICFLPSPLPGHRCQLHHMALLTVAKTCCRLPPPLTI